MELRSTRCCFDKRIAMAFRSGMDGLKACKIHTTPYTKSMSRSSVVELNSYRASFSFIAYRPCCEDIQTQSSKSFSLPAHVLFTRCKVARSSFLALSYTTYTN